VGTEGFPGLEADVTTEGAGLLTGLAGFDGTLIGVPTGFTGAATIEIGLEVTGFNETGFNEIGLEGTGFDDMETTIGLFVTGGVLVGTIGFKVAGCCVTGLKVT